MHLDEIGSSEPCDVYSFFGFHKPMPSTNENNDSTDAVDGDFNNSRDNLDQAFDMEDAMMIDNFNNNDEGIPPEYANDPDVW